MIPLLHFAKFVAFLGIAWVLWRFARNLVRRVFLAQNKHSIQPKRLDEVGIGEFAWIQGELDGTSVVSPLTSRTCLYWSLMCDFMSDQSVWSQTLLTSDVSLAKPTIRLEISSDCSIGLNKQDSFCQATMELSKAPAIVRSHFHSAKSQPSVRLAEGILHPLQMVWIHGQKTSSQTFRVSRIQDSPQLPLVR